MISFWGPWWRRRVSDLCGLVFSPQSSFVWPLAQMEASPGLSDKTSRAFPAELFLVCSRTPLAACRNSAWQFCRNWLSSYCWVGEDQKRFLSSRCYWFFEGLQNHHSISQGSSHNNCSTRPPLRSSGQDDRPRDTGSNSLSRIRPTYLSTLPSSVADFDLDFWISPGIVIGFIFFRLNFDHRSLSPFPALCSSLLFPSSVFELPRSSARWYLAPPE